MPLGLLDNYVDCFWNVATSWVMWQRIMVMPGMPLGFGILVGLFGLFGML